MRRRSSSPALRRRLPLPSSPPSPPLVLVTGTLPLPASLVLLVLVLLLVLAPPAGTVPVLPLLRTGLPLAPRSGPPRPPRRASGKKSLELPRQSKLKKHLDKKENKHRELILRNGNFGDLIINIKGNTKNGGGFLLASLLCNSGRISEFGSKCAALMRERYSSFLLIRKGGGKRESPVRPLGWT